MNFFGIDNVAFQIWGYPVSYVELIGTLFGLASVYFASRANILTWPTGIVNEIFLLLLFFQVQLYADMFLQIYFLGITIFGWYNWKTGPGKNKITETTTRVRIYLASVILIGSLLAGILFKNIHTYLPQYFKIPAAYPFTDSFIMVSSIVATVLLAKKKIENWYLWIAIDIICVLLYYRKATYFLSIEYFIFLGLAIYGLYNWKKQLKND